MPALREQTFARWAGVRGLTHRTARNVDNWGGWRNFTPVDTLERNQVRLILEHLTSETLRMTENAQKAMHAEHSATKMLQSGNTVRRAVDIVEEHAAKFVEQAVDQTAAVAQDMDAFNVIAASLTAMFRGFEVHLQNAVRLATIRDSQRSQNVVDAGNKLFSEMRSRIFKQLEIHRFSFTKPTKGDLAAQHERVFGSPAPLATDARPKNPGGKPLAAHWDALWATIAAQLWLGDLEPKSQKDIKEAMFDWFNSAGIEIGDTAVTQRARQLWQAMEEIRRKEG